MAHLNENIKPQSNESLFNLLLLDIAPKIEKSELTLD